MTTIERIHTRRSIRKYKSDPVPQELLDKVIEAGTWAPTGRNLQSPIIVAITNKEVRDRYAHENATVGPMKFPEGHDPFYGAPVVLVVLADKKVFTRVCDGSLVIGNMMLAADELGLGSCWIHRAKEVFEKPEWQEWLKSIGVEGEYEAVGNCILGYPDEAPKAAPRKENWVYYAK